MERNEYSRDVQALRRLAFVCKRLRVVAHEVLHTDVALPQRSNNTNS